MVAKAIPRAIGVIELDCKFGSLFQPGLNNVGGWESQLDIRVLLNNLQDLLPNNLTGFIAYYAFISDNMYLIPITRNIS